MDACDERAPDTRPPEPPLEALRPEQIAALCVRLCAAHDDRPDALIEVLHAVQARLGYVPDAAVPAIAEALNLSRADVHGVLTFYSDFRRRPPGRHVLRLCRAEACQARGGERLAEWLAKQLGIDFGETTDDGAIRLETAYCLGSCALGPNALVDGERLVGRLDEARLDGLVASLREVAGR